MQENDDLCAYEVLLQLMNSGLLRRSDMPMMAKKDQPCTRQSFLVGVC